LRVVVFIQWKLQLAYRWDRSTNKASGRRILIKILLSK
jgi:hypothetical protein